MLSCNFSKSDISPKLEPHYAQSVLAYHGKDYAKALHLVDGLLTQAPHTPEFLELKALILQTQAKPKESAALYEQLIQIKKAQNAPVQALAPYYFALGVIYFKQNRYPLAHDYFITALEAPFNVESAHFFLGMLAFKEEHWSEAADHLAEVMRGQVAELIPVATFYRGQVFLRLGIPMSATYSFFEARQGARAQMQDPELSVEAKKIAQQIDHSTTTALQPFDRNSFFGGASLLTGYDTNVLLQGSGTNSSGVSSSPTQQSTLKETLLTSVGYSTSPLHEFQLVPSYKMAFNFNFNAATRSGEYFLHDLSLYVTRYPLARWSYGMKFEGIYTLQDQVNLDNSRNYSPFSMAASFGPFSRYEITPTLIAAGELNVTPQKYYGDLTVDPTYQKGGTDINAKLALKYDPGSTIWNPGGYFQYEKNNANGYEYNYGGFTLEANNTLRLLDHFSTSISVDFSRFHYNRDGNTPRDDSIFVVNMNHQYKLSSQINLLSELQWTWDNVSCTDPSIVGLFQYNRFVTSIGVNYVF